MSSAATRSNGAGKSEATRIAMDDGLQVYVKQWSVADPTTRKGVIVFNHGFSEHIDAYDNFFKLVNEYGYDVVGYDQRGSGKTSPTKKTFGNTNEYHVFNDLEKILNEVVKEYPVGTPVIMWGHSMGGAIALTYGVFGKRRQDLAAYMSDAPLIEVHPKAQAPKILTALIPIIAKIYPKYKSKVNLNDELLTDDKEKIEEYRRDPLRLKLTTAEMANDFLNRGKRLTEASFVRKFVDKPVLVSHGTGDFVNDYEGSKKFFGLLQVKDKQFDTYEGWPHELAHMTQPKREEHCQRVMDWLTARVPGGVAAATVTSVPATTAAPVARKVPSNEPVAPAVPAKEVSQPVTTTAPAEPIKETLPVVPAVETAPVKESIPEPAPVPVPAVEAKEIAQETAPVATEPVVPVEIAKETIPVEETHQVVEDEATHAEATIDSSKQLETETVKAQGSEPEPISVSAVETETAHISVPETSTEEPKDLVVETQDKIEATEGQVSKTEAVTTEVAPKVETTEPEVAPKAEEAAPVTKEGEEEEGDDDEGDTTQDKSDGGATPKPSAGNKKKNKKKKKKGKR